MYHDYSNVFGTHPFVGGVSERQRWAELKAYLKPSSNLYILLKYLVF